MAVNALEFNKRYPISLFERKRQLWALTAEEVALAIKVRGHALAPVERNVSNIFDRNGTFAPSGIEVPSSMPSTIPSAGVAAEPSVTPSITPSIGAVPEPSAIPSAGAVSEPSAVPSAGEVSEPSAVPSAGEVSEPSAVPSEVLSTVPSVGVVQTDTPSQGQGEPSNLPSVLPSQGEVAEPSQVPSVTPSLAPSVAAGEPSDIPSVVPSAGEVVFPSGTPSGGEVASPSLFPSWLPSFFPSGGDGVPTTLPTPGGEVGEPSSQPSLRGGQPSVSNTPSATPQDTSQQIQIFLANTLTDDGALTTDGTPQNLAYNQLLNTSNGLDPTIPGDALEITQRYTLNTIFYSTQLEGWRNRSGWTTAAPICGSNSDPWFGVTCDDVNVTGIELRSNNLVGLLPSELRGVSNLQTLDLGGSRGIFGAIPTTIGENTALQRLVLDNNFLGLIPDGDSVRPIEGAIPTQLSNITSLRNLTLAQNGFVGAFPISILQPLTNLEHLDIGINFFQVSWASVVLAQLADLQCD